MKAVTVALLMLCLYSLASGQKPVRPEAAKHFRNANRFAERYDKFHDRTIVTVGPFVMSGGTELFMTNRMFYMLAGFSYQGQKLEHAPDQFVLGFSVEGGERFTFLKDQEVIVLADGERFQLGNADRDSDFYFSSVKESLLVSVPKDTFEKIGKAKSVEIKVGPKVFKLKDEHLEAFRDLASLAEPKT